MPRLRTRATLRFGTIAAAALVACSGDPEGAGSGEAPTPGTTAPPTADAAYRAMVASEETVAELTPSIAKLARAVRDLSLPGHFARELFAEDAEAIDLASPGQRAADPQLPVSHRDWTPAARAGALAEIEGGLWAPLWREVESFEDARFGVLAGKAEPGGAFTTKLKFSAIGGCTDGSAGAWKGKVALRWENRGDLWEVVRWETLELHESRSPKPLFREVLAEAIPDPAELRRARESIHERYIREVFFTGGTKFAYPKDYWPYITSWDSLDQHPSVAVVDVDADGWDDFYVTARWGRNQLWRNRGDGTFEDIAPRVGLDIDGTCNAALFADFDNDGDPDCFLGRSLERARYLENVGGRFVDRSETGFDRPLPYWTSSLAAADVDGDGLLDLHIATYRLPITKPFNVLATAFLAPEEREEWKRRRAGDHPVFRLTGPPNVLLMNRGGGRFETAPEAGGAELWLSSFHGTFSDFDNDGDPDLLVANDYAPDHVFRNESGRFTDVTSELAGDQLQGFGMGVSLGDYDNDGRLDPYFTYMYSKAGGRVTSMFEGLERRMYEGVAGNKLLRNTPSGFEDVTGDGAGQMAVARTGWSWGGQFADLDNDGWLDLYVANGLYTPPAGTQTEVDL